MPTFVRRKILGKWRDGYALDIHTVSSTFIGYDEFGHPRFETTRSEVGELLYRLKNKADRTVLPRIVDAVQVLLKEWAPQVDALVPVPPSARRSVQPVTVLAQEISGRIGIPLIDCVSRIRDVPQLKNVYDLDERARLLEGLHKIDQSVTGKRVLLFDDLYRSGATMNAITADLYEIGKVADVYALAITRTRSNQ